jgi:hypothetical protein
MIPIIVFNGLPFVEVTLTANEEKLTLTRVLLDTGSAATIFKTDDLAKLNIFTQPYDSIHLMTGIGGHETVVEKQIDKIELGNLTISPFIIQLGAVDYGLPMDGILGFDFLVKAGAHIDFKTMAISD